MGPRLNLVLGQILQVLHFLLGEDSSGLTQSPPTRVIGLLPKASKDLGSRNRCSSQALDPHTQLNHSSSP